MKLEELEQAVPMDVRGTLSRFGGSRALVVRFLRKFPQDGAYSALAAAVERQDWPEVERSAHTLKGVAANLGLERVRTGSDALVQTVRRGETEAVSALFRGLQADYEAACGAIAALEE
ncbi:MAG TPA: Hpt domain-containing protein [Candidatus Flavonifractor intestinipullorum]|uniref:Hpt domain-containing protein n=1 Tax=Candidatus Flavonifractor intestinipullorum TaxID=2838587 RepID=A0A9D2MA16_9FIRM|nr:Hpt domain-containing protein [Candidatus Flavonifractor intestinipullorum]